MDVRTMIYITVDDREREAPVVALLGRRDDLVLSVERLALGDYFTKQSSLVARKTLRGLVVSVKDGRLFRQGCRLAGSSVRTRLLLEGTGSDLAHCQRRRQAVPERPSRAP